MCFLLTSSQRLLVQEIALGPALFFAKMSLLLLYLKLFSLNRRTRRLIYSAMILSIPLYWIGVVLNAYYFTPHIGEKWDPFLIATRAAHASIWGIIRAALNVIFDLFILTIPIAVILELNLPRNTKAAICVVFLPGFM